METGKIKDINNMKTSTLGEHAEKWYVEQGKIIPDKDSVEWNHMYQKWVMFAFQDFAGDNMNEYILAGSYRKCTSIGSFEDFSFEWCDYTPKQAMNSLRKLLIKQGYEHILFKQCFCDGQEISMLEALELE